MCRFFVCFNRPAGHDIELSSRVEQVNNGQHSGNVFPAQQVVLALHDLTDCEANIVLQGANIDFTDHHWPLVLVIESEVEADIGTTTYKGSYTITCRDIGVGVDK